MQVTPADELEYLRQREAAEWAASAETACMARTAHEDLAETYAERAEALEQAAAENEARLGELLGRLDEVAKD